jgi:hypothetical protein
MGATLRQTVVAALQGLVADTILQYAPLGPAGPTQSAALLTGPGTVPGFLGAPGVAIAKQEIYEALARRRFTVQFTDGGTIGTGVAESPCMCVSSLVTSNVPTGVSQGIRITGVWVNSLVALGSGIAFGSPGWTVSIAKRSPQVAGLGPAIIALGTTQTGDLGLGLGFNAFQPTQIAILGSIPGGATVTTNTSGGSLGQTIVAGAGSTITVVSTAGFPSSGSLQVPNAAGGFVLMSYTAIGSATTFTGAIGPGFTTPAAAAAVLPYANAVNSIAAGSNGASLPQATINVASVVGFLPATAAQPQQVQVTTAAGVQTVTYTGMTTTSFTGCTGGTGAMATGGLVQGLYPIALCANGDVLTFTLLKVSTGLAVASATGPACLVVEYEEA